MPLSTVSIGHSTRPIQHQVDARWLMAYAAGIGDLNPRYMDTLGERVTGHPVFPVCLEWPVVLSSRELPGYDLVTPAERARGVHASHDLHIYRPIRAGDRLTTQATHIGLRRIKPGAAQLTRLDTVDADGVLVCRTYQLGISRGVEVLGADTEIEAPPAWPTASDGALGAPRRVDVPVAAGAAHVYTECARIWNPIHTDRAVAVGAGLPDIILHGTATLALAVTRIVDELLGGDPGRVRRLGGRFSAMVLMPSTITVEMQAGEGVVFFRVLTDSGVEAFSNGFLCHE